MQQAGHLVKWICGFGMAGMILAGNWQRAAAIPAPVDTPVIESQVLDLTAEAMGWPERAGGDSYVSHTVKSGDLSMQSVVRWMIRPASLFVYGGNQPGEAFGETRGYPSGSSCTVAGGCNPPNTSRYFAFNFDMDRDGDHNLDTPAERYLSFHCEVTITAPEAQLYAPINEAEALCTILLEKAIEVRASLMIPACVGVVCPSSKCEGNIRYTGGTCDPESGQCIYPSSEDCGSLGCDAGTGKCNQMESPDLCADVTCEPAFCEENMSYSDPACDKADGTCAYFQKDDCGAAGCNPETGRCNNPEPVTCGDKQCKPAVCIDNVSYSSPACDPDDGSCGYYAQKDCGTAGCDAETGQCNPSVPNPCGGLSPLALIPLALVMRKPKRKNSDSKSQGGCHEAIGS